MAAHAICFLENEIQTFRIHFQKQERKKLNEDMAFSLKKATTENMLRFVKRKCF